MDNGNCDLIAIPAVIGVGTYNDIVTYNNGCGLYSLVYIYTDPTLGTWYSS